MHSQAHARAKHSLITPFIIHFTGSAQEQKPNEHFNANYMYAEHAWRAQLEEIVAIAA